MTMTIRLEMSLDEEKRLRDSIARHDSDSIQQVLSKALIPAIEALLRDEQAQPDVNAIELLLDGFEDIVPPELPLLSDYAVSRAGIYEDCL